MPARTGEQFLKGLKGPREVWVDGERVSDVVSHPSSAARRTRWPRSTTCSTTTPATCLMPDPETGEPINVEPHDPALARRPRAARQGAARSGRGHGRPDGPHARLHERHLRGLRRPARRMGRATATRRAPSAGRLPEGPAPRRLLADPRHHPPDRRQGAGRRAGGRRRARAAQGGRDRHGIVVRGARMLATLAPFADEMCGLSGAPLPQAPTPTRSPSPSRWRRRASSSSAATASRRAGNRFDHPLSSRFDEQDAFVIFDDVEVPRDRVFIDATSRPTTR